MSMTFVSGRAVTGHRIVCTLALALIVIGIAIAVFGTMFSAAPPCWFDVLQFDGELYGLDWTGWGGLAASAGLVLLLADFRGLTAGSALRWELGGSLLLSLYWATVQAPHVVIEFFRLRPIDPRVKAFLRVYSAPADLAYEAIAMLKIPTCEQGYFIFAETAFLGAVVTILCWWLGVSFVTGRMRRHRV